MESSLSIDILGNQRNFSVIDSLSEMDYLASGVPRCRPDFLSLPWWWTHRDAQTPSSSRQQPENTPPMSKAPNWTLMFTVRRKRKTGSSPWVPAALRYPLEPSRPSSSCSVECDQSDALRPSTVAMWPDAEESQCKYMWLLSSCSGN